MAAANTEKYLQQPFFTRLFDFSDIAISVLNCAFCLHLFFTEENKGFSGRNLFRFSLGMSAASADNITVQSGFHREHFIVVGAGCFYQNVFQPDAIM